MNTLNFIKSTSGAIKQDVATIHQLSMFQKFRQIQKDTITYRKIQLNYGFSGKVEEKKYLQLAKEFIQHKNEQKLINNTIQKITQEKEKFKWDDFSPPTIYSYDKYMFIILTGLVGVSTGYQAAKKGKKTNNNLSYLRWEFVGGALLGSVCAIPLWLSWCHPLRLIILGGGLVAYQIVPRIV
jgi:hypothetical protein